MKDDALDKAFSLFIRERDTDAQGYGRCCTCGKTIHLKEGHCGHFISRRHLATRWDEENCALQCAGCNLFNQGRQFEFSRYIDKKYGQGTADKILARSRMTKKYGKFEFDILKRHYSELVKELKKQKGII